jgi:hypothetical protein
MTERPEPGADAQSRRQRRLADALRSNLKRRKAQERGRSGASDRNEPEDVSKSTGGSD